MRLHVMSDLHVEFHGPHKPYLPHIPEADATILAGDIDIDGKGIHWARQYFNRPTIIIPGNHEYYNRNFDYVNLNFDEPDNGMIIPARRMSVEIMNTRFLCCTLWTDYALHEDPEDAMELANRCMNDHIIIMKGGDKFRAQDARHQHDLDVRFLIEKFEEPFEGKTVVVTHHLPIPECIAPEWQNSRLNPAFASDLRWMIDKYKPALWIYGHTHSSADFMYDQTRMLCNPRGYFPKDLNPKFKPDLVVEI